MNNNNRLYLIVGALLVLVIGMAVYIYDKEHRPKDGVEIKIDSNGLKVEGN